MGLSIEDLFSQVAEFRWKEKNALAHPTSFSTFENLKKFLDLIHIKQGLLQPYLENDDYPLVAPQELLPSFETSLYENVNLPGFSMVVIDRPIDYFQEIFQFDILHSFQDALDCSNGPATPLESLVSHQNRETFMSRLPRHYIDSFKQDAENADITDLRLYPKIMAYLLHMDRGHVIAKNRDGDFYLSGIYASFPSDLDSELKRFGLKMGKFKPGDNHLYEINRIFVYQFLMELYGYPIASERRTSAALFARRLFRMGEEFMITTLGQSDRTITNIYVSPEHRQYLKVEKIGLVPVDKVQKEYWKIFRNKGFIVEGPNPAVVLKLEYRQHKYDPNNIQRDRALSVVAQSAINPWNGEEYKSTNIIKDTALMTLTLNDIIKGEFFGRVKYKGKEIVENTDTHVKRLKVLYAWLRKHQRRIIGYSDEFYNIVSKILDNYLLNPDNYDIFASMPNLHEEVWKQYSYIQQARKIKLLQDLSQKKYKGKKINYLQLLQYSTQIVQELKFEIVNYFDSLVAQALTICENILNNRYLLKRYVHPHPDELTDYGRKIKKLYGHLVKQIDELMIIRKSRVYQEKKCLEN